MAEQDPSNHGQDPSLRVGDIAEDNAEYVGHLLETASPDEYLGIMAAQEPGDIPSSAGKISGNNMLIGLDAAVKGIVDSDQRDWSDGIGIPSKGGLRGYYEAHREALAETTIPRIESDGKVRLHNREQLQGFLMARMQGSGIRSPEEGARLDAGEVTERIQKVINTVNAFADRPDIHSSIVVSSVFEGEDRVPEGIAESVVNILMSELKQNPGQKLENIIEDEEEPLEEATVVGEPVAASNPPGLSALAEENVIERSDGDQVAPVQESADAGAQVVQDQITQLEDGEGVEHVGDLTDTDIQPTEHLGAAVEAEPVEEAEELESFMSYEDLVANHVEDIIRGKTLIEGADPEMVGNLVQQVRSIESLYAEAKLESGMAGVGDGVIQATAELVRNGDALHQVEARIQHALENLKMFNQAAINLINFVRDGGRHDYLADYQRPFMQAAAELGIGPNGNGSIVQEVVSGDVFEATFELYRNVSDEANQAESEIHRLRGEAAAPDMAETQEAMVSMFNQSGQKLQEMRQAVYDRFPEYEAAHRHLADVHDIATSIHTVGNVLNFEKTTGYHNQDANTAFQGFLNQAEIVYDKMTNTYNPQINALDVEELVTMASQVERIIDEIKTANIRMKTMAEAVLPKN